MNMAFIFEQALK